MKNFIETGFIEIITDWTDFYFRPVFFWFLIHFLCSKISMDISVVRRCFSEYYRRIPKKNSNDGDFFCYSFMPTAREIFQNFAEQDYWKILFYSCSNWFIFANNWCNKLTRFANLEWCKLYWWPYGIRLSHIFEPGNT